MIKFSIKHGEEFIAFLSEGIIPIMIRSMHRDGDDINVCIERIKQKILAYNPSSMNIIFEKMDAFSTTDASAVVIIASRLSNSYYILELLNRNGSIEWDITREVWGDRL